MEKIPTCFRRDPANPRQLLREPHPACGWVFAGEGVATRKYDGTCCMIRDGKLYKRRELKRGHAAPAGFESVETDETTMKIVGWVPCNRDDPGDKWHYEAFDRFIGPSGDLSGTYELCGPKVQGNLEQYDEHILIRHAAAEIYADFPRSYDEMAQWFVGKDLEGIVFHHPDGRKAKIKKRDFGLTR